MSQVYQIGLNICVLVPNNVDKISTLVQVSSVRSHVLAYLMLEYATWGIRVERNKSCICESCAI